MQFIRSVVRLDVECSMSALSITQSGYFRVCIWIILQH